MKTETKLRFMMAGLLVCLTGLVGQSVYLWQVEKTIAAAPGDGSALPEDIQQRLEAETTGPALTADPFDLNGWFGQATPIDPAAQIQQMQKQMDSLFGSFGGSGFSAFSGSQFSTIAPTLNLQETDSEYQVHIQTPPDENLEIDTELESNSLVVSGTVSQNSSSTGNGAQSSFMSQSQFSRTFDLPETVDEFGIYTEQEEDGLLIHVPKKQV